MLVNTVTAVREISLNLQVNNTRVAIGVAGVGRDGRYLCRNGRMSLLVIAANSDVYLVDIHKLQHSAFISGGLKDFLEDSH